MRAYSGLLGAHGCAAMILLEHVVGKRVKEAAITTPSNKAIRSQICPTFVQQILLNTNGLVPII